MLDSGREGETWRDEVVSETLKIRAEMGVSAERDDWSRLSQVSASLS